MQLDYRNYRQPVVIWTSLVSITVLLVVVLFSREVGGARRWLWLFGIIGIQPSEFAKLVVILFSAAILERRMGRINDIGYALAPIAIVVATVSGLILLEPDLGNGSIHYRDCWGHDLHRWPQFSVSTWRWARHPSGVRCCRSRFTGEMESLDHIFGIRGKTRWVMGGR